MDEHAISIIAETTVSLLVPYLKSLSEEFVKKAGEQIGGTLGETAWTKAKQLYEVVKGKFSSKPESNKVITALEEAPHDEDTEGAVRFHLKNMMASDENFAKELALILREASKVRVDTVFQTKIIGNVEKLVQMGNVYGNVEI